MSSPLGGSEERAGQGILAGLDESHFHLGTLLAICTLSLVSCQSQDRGALEAERQRLQDEVHHAVPNPSKPKAYTLRCKKWWNHVSTSTLMINAKTTSIGGSLSQVITTYRSTVFVPYLTVFRVPFSLLRVEIKKSGDCKIHSGT